MLLFFFCEPLIYFTAVYLRNSTLPFSYQMDNHLYNSFFKIFFLTSIIWFTWNVLRFMWRVEGLIWFSLNSWVNSGKGSSYRRYIFPAGSAGKESSCQCRRHRKRKFDPWVRKIPWRKKWLPTPVFLPKKSHGQRSLLGYSPWSGEESNTTEQLSTHRYTQWGYKVAEGRAFVKWGPPGLACWEVVVGDKSERLAGAAAACGAPPDSVPWGGGRKPLRVMMGVLL